MPYLTGRPFLLPNGDDMELHEYHWTLIGNGPSKIKLIMCTYDDCGLIGSALTFEQAVLIAQGHTAERNSKA